MHAILDDVELLARLVGFDSTSRNSNLPIADFICDYLDRPGIDIDRVPSPDGEKTNLCVTIGSAAGGRGMDRANGAGTRDGAGGLVLSGHMDVVPADEAEWHSDPFVLEERDGMLIGRGACDMKGFLAVAMNAAARVDSAALRNPLVLLFTYDEELGTLGARRFVDCWPADRPLPRAAIIGEPTSMRVVRMHKGHMKARLTLRGVPAHSGYPHLGVNAIEMAGRAITALTGLRAVLETERPDSAAHFPEVPFVAFNLGTIDGGRAVNVVPDRCVIELGFRVLPGMDGMQIAGRVREALAAALPPGEYRLETLAESPPLLVREEAPVLAALRKELGTTGPESVSYATDGGWLQNLGLDCAICGPGDIAQAHKPNESVAVAELRRCARLLDSVIGRFCGGP